MMSTGLMDLKDGAMMKNEGMDGRELYLTSFAKVIILNGVTSWVLFIFNGRCGKVIDLSCHEKGILCVWEYSKI